MWPFKKKEFMELDVPDGEGGFKKVKVAKAQWEQWQREGKIGPPACQVHLLRDSSKPDLVYWTLGEDLSQEVYDQFKDANGDIFAATWRDDEGEKQVSVLRRDKWDELRKRLQVLD